MEFDEIMVKESPGLCRCCLSEGCYKDMGTEYAWMNENEVYADMLLECFDISISQLNDGPNGPNRLICEVCITRLRDACYFKKQVLESEKKFVDMVGRGEFKSKVYPTNMKAETADDEDAASFGTDDGDPEYLDDEIEYLEEDILKAETQEPGVSDVTADPLPIRGKRGRPRKAPVKTDKKKVKTEPKAKSSKAVPKGKRHNVSIGRHTKDALRARRYRQSKLLEQNPKPRGRPKKAKTAASNSREPKTTTKIVKDLSTDLKTNNVKTKDKVKTKKCRAKNPPPLSRAEKRAYQFAKPIIKATTNKTSYNLKIQQHLSLSDLGIADESKTDDEGDSSRKSILHHMKLAMGRVRLGKN